MIEHKIIEKIAVISERTGGWKLELNRVKWNNGMEKLDLRPWNEDHSKCSKGLTLTDKEAAILCGVLEGIL